MHRAIGGKVSGIVSRHLATSKVASCFAYRAASGLPDWDSYSPGTEASSSDDQPELWSEQASAASDFAAQSATAEGGPVGTAINLIDGLQTVSGLPWWATLSVTALGVRAALFPLAVRQLQASSALASVLKQTQPPAQTVSQGQQLQQTLQKVAALQRQRSLPSPLWIVAAPLAQIPLFVTAVMAVRRMSATAWPGFDTGGLLWFPDLCLPALDLASATAPLGSIGMALPAGVALAMFANIQRSFGVAANSQGSAVMMWLMGNVKLFMEWLTVPIFIIALQLPQGAALYWLVSSLTALAQGYILQAPAARAMLSLPSASPPLTSLAPQQATLPLPSHHQHGPGGVTVPPANRQMVEGNTRGLPTEAKGAQAALPRQPQPVDMQKLLTVTSAVRKLASKSTDSHAMLLKAAEFRAEGAVAASQHCLKRVLELQPDLAQGHFAMGQNHAALREWPLAEQAFLTAAEQHQDGRQQARCWFGAAISQQMQAEHDTALQSLNIAESLTYQKLRQLNAEPGRHKPGLTSAESSTSDEDLPDAESTTLSGSQDTEQKRASNVLAVKVLLAKASILKQLQRTDEAKECMKCAKQLDPAVEKYVRQ